MRGECDHRHSKADCADHREHSKEIVPRIWGRLDFIRCRRADRGQSDVDRGSTSRRRCIVCDRRRRLRPSGRTAELGRPHVEYRGKGRRAAKASFICSECPARASERALLRFVVAVRCVGAERLRRERAEGPRAGCERDGWDWVGRSAVMVPWVNGSRLDCACISGK